jgi:hypothetical protein
MTRAIVLFFLVALAAPQVSSEAADPRLFGVWATRSYVIEGKDHAMDGLFIFTQRHFSANAFFQVSGGKLDDLNANAGTYSTEGEKLIFMQQVQAHIRPGDPKEPIFYGKGVEEVATYKIEGDKLLIIFPSQNRYVCERLK